MYFFLKHKNVKSQYNLLLSLYKPLLEEKKEKESSKRLAKLTTVGWHRVSEEKNPNKKMWDVIFELKEIAVSVDETKSKFEVISVASKESGDTWTKDQYTKWFIQNYGGGWINIDNPKLEWITTMSKSEQRDIKLKELGI